MKYHGAMSIKQLIIWTICLQIGWCEYKSNWQPVLVAECNQQDTPTSSGTVGPHDLSHLTSELPIDSAPDQAPSSSNDIVDSSVTTPASDRDAVGSSDEAITRDASSEPAEWPDAVDEFEKVIKDDDFNKIDYKEEPRDSSSEGLNEKPDTTGGPLEPTPSPESSPPPSTALTTEAEVQQTTWSEKPDTNSENSTSDSTTPAPTTSAPPKKPPNESSIDCFNGGVRVMMENGQMGCKCPAEFYGPRCQFRNYCKTIVAPGLSGDEVCKRINRECDQSNDKFFRCICHGDEYFVFKVGQLSNNNQPANKDPLATFAYDSLLPLDSPANGASVGSSNQAHLKSQMNGDKMQQQQHQRQTYLAECRPTNKCLGVRCRQMSEVCHEGKCICNRDLGYIPDPSDNLCKLLDPCRMPQAEGEKPICGQAKCVATYDRDLYRCVCPIGYKAVKKEETKNTTQCAPLTDKVCKIPLLNKCQHICEVDLRNSEYKCSCMPGYRPGTRLGIDDHMCFFDEHPGDPMDAANERLHLERHHQFGVEPTSGLPVDNPGAYHGGRSATDPGSQVKFVYRAYSLDVLHSTPPSVRQTDQNRTANHKFSYDDPKEHQASGSGRSDNRYDDLQEQSGERQDQSERLDVDLDSAPTLASPLGRVNSRNLIIKREPVRSSAAADDGGASYYGDKARDHDRLEGQRGRLDESSYYGGDVDGLINLSLLTAQERCNMYCEENKICVLEQGTLDSYRCVCDRQGYVSIGDRCLDWCTAAEFSHSVQAWLEQVCYSGLCRPVDSRPLPYMKHKTATTSQSNNLNDPASKRSDHKASKNNNNRPINQEALRRLRESSWRPTFECDCSTSPLLKQDPDTRLCQLNFDKIIEPCLPGNEGYVDCVQNKNAYCAVFHRPIAYFLRDLQRDPPSPIEGQSGAGPGGSGSSGILGKPESLMADLKLQQGESSGEKQQPLSGNKKTAKTKPDKLYTCVCSPEKKFLVDKPRNKARCINECDLLKNECGRFNMMCQNATIDPLEFNRWSSKTELVNYDRGEIRMKPFKRTKCECLPGFNVGPSDPIYSPADSDGEESAEISDGLVGLDDGQANRQTTTVYGPAGGFGGPANTNMMHPLPQQDTPQQTISGAGSTPISAIIHEPYLTLPGEFGINELSGLPRAGKHLSIESRCLLDFDVVEFHATFKAPANFEPSWVTIANKVPLELEPPQSKGWHSEGAPATPNNETGSTKPNEPGGGNLPLRTGRDMDDSGDDREEDENQPELPDSLGRSASARRREQQQQQQQQQQAKADPNTCKTSNDCLLKMPDYMRTDISELHKKVVLVAQCNHVLAPLSLQAYQECVRYRYWMAQKFRNHFADWREIMAQQLKETFDLMDGNIRLRVNECKATIRRLATIPKAFKDSFEEPKSEKAAQKEANHYAKVLLPQGVDQSELKQLRISSSPVVAEYDPLDQYALIDADLDCELTIHSASNDWRNARKVLLEKQLPKFIVKENDKFGPHHYLMAPNILIHRESFDQLAKHRKPFSPCQSSYAYCDSQTRCEKVDTVNFSCTCKYGFTPIGSRHIYQFDSRKEVCEDIDECLFDVCKENGLENKSTCYNEIGDYRCQCDRHHVGDNKRHCTHICTLLACKFGECRIFDEHHAYCECHEGYREADCSVQDPGVALRKANMIIVGSIFTSILLLAIALAISLNSQLKKAKKKLKRLEAAYEAAQLFDMPHQQPFRPRLSKVSGCS